MFKVLDVFFVVFHSGLIIFNLIGWAFRSTRKLNLITLLITGSSWVFLGIFYGIGYCPLTEWHWQILHKSGKFDLPSSYIQYLFQRFFGIHISHDLTIILTFGLYSIALIISIYLNKRKRKFTF